MVVDIEQDDLPERAFRLPANRNVSFLYAFSGQSMKLGAMAVSPSGTDFAPGTSHAGVHLDFWADDEWTEIVQPGRTFTIWYGGDVGRGLVVGTRGLASSSGP